MDSDLLDPTVTMIAFDRLPTPGPSKLSFISPPVSRASSLSGDDHRDTPDPSSSSSKTHSFFSNPFSSKPSVPNLRPPPRLVPTTPSNRSVSDSSPRAATDSFFSSANVSPRPTPPPSIHSHSRNSSEGDGTTPKPLLPPIARFFPSRGPTLPDPRRIPDDRDDLLSPPMPTSASPSSSARSFVSLEIDDASDFGGGALTTSSPTSATPSSPTFSSPKFNYSRSSASSSAPSSTSSSVDPSYILRPNAIIGADVPLSLVRKLGDGAFSSVWLAVDIDHHLSPGILRNKRRLRSQSDARHKRDINLHGLRPSGRTKKEKDDTILLDEHDGEGGSLPHLIVSREGGEESDDEDGEHDLGRLVAVKMMDRAMCDADDRTRISFVREVEVLRHISHPSIVSYLHSFTIPSHHCLVLEYLDGGELFDFLNLDENFHRLSEPILRRMWSELCRAVGWMHGVGLVHRDIKLENILLARSPFQNTHSPSPLLKLTDFGLSRFINPSSPLLTTRCGSESYAAPEIVTGQPYDGRQTDAWACGVVLYAMATRKLPFDEWGIDEMVHEGHLAVDGRGSPPASESRRHYLLRIAKGEYTWPPSSGHPASELASEGLRNVVARLLVRDPSKRARMIEIWDEEWMKAGQEGVLDPPSCVRDKVHETLTEGDDEIMYDHDHERRGCEGELVDGEIPIVARSEVS